MHFPAVKSINMKAIFRSRRNTGIQVELSDLYQGKTCICTTKTKVGNNSLCVELKDFSSISFSYWLGDDRIEEGGRGKRSGMVNNILLISWFFSK